MTQPAGWFSDPYGRYQQRYWNGSEWTEHVSTDATQSVDPLGSTTVVPIAIPASAYETADPSTTAATASRPVQPRRFLDSLGAGARDRPVPRLSIALAGGGGALVAFGIDAAILGDTTSRGRAIGAAIIILCAALFVRLGVTHQPDLMSSAVGAGVIGLGTLGGAIVADHIDASWAPLVVGLLFLAAWVLPGFRGRPIMLGIGALLMVAAFGSATASSGAGSTGVLGDVPFSDAVGDQQVVFLLAAAVLFALVWWLDRAGYFGVGTSLVVAALVSAFVGVGEATSNLGDTGATILIVAVGLLVCFVGSHGDRRATTWWGALLTAIGLVGFFVATMTPDSVGSTAAVLLVSGLLLIVGPAAARAIRASRQRTDAPPSAGTLPPPSL
jgi:hypothetical protein